MSTTFTNTTRTPISWDAPPPVEVEGEAYVFLISDTYKLDIGNGFNLTIKPAAVDIQWTTTDKAQGGNMWPAPALSNVNYVDIGGGFNLLIGNGYKLQISTGATNETAWTPVTKNAPAQY